jgi:hypothetical protein
VLGYVRCHRVACKLDGVCVVFIHGSYSTMVMMNVQEQQAEMSGTMGRTAEGNIFCLGGGCDEYSPATVHCKTLYMYSLRIPNRAFPHDGRILVGTSLLQYCNGADATIRPVPPGTYRYA